MRVKLPGCKVRDLIILKNCLVFGDDGFAEADHLTKKEIARCRQLGFVFEDTAKVVPASREQLEQNQYEPLDEDSENEIGTEPDSSVKGSSVALAEEPHDSTEPTAKKDRLPKEELPETILDDASKEDVSPMSISPETVHPVDASEPTKIRRKEGDK